MKKEKTLVLIEKYKGFDIFYDKDKERFVADDKAHERHFEAFRLFEIKGSIASSMTEPADKKGIIKSGYFNKSLSKIQLLSINKSTGTSKYKILEDTEKSYNTGKIEDRDIPKIYELTDHNLDIYQQVTEMERKIEEIELSQKVLVGKLK